MILGYGLGALGQGAAYYFMSSYFVVFLTNCVGLGAAGSRYDFFDSLAGRSDSRNDSREPVRQMHVEDGQAQAFHAHIVHSDAADIGDNASQRRRLLDI